MGAMGLYPHLGCENLWGNVGSASQFHKGVYREASVCCEEFKKKLVQTDIPAEKADKYKDL